MEKFTIMKSSGSPAACVKEIPEYPEGIVIAVHGISSSKESSTVRMLLERLPAAGFGVIGIDLPGHGTAESAKEILRISGAIDSIEAAEKYALQEYPGHEIYYFASSFGAYLTGLYISTRKHAGRKAFWRSAAVNMPDLFHKENPTEEEKQQLRDLEEKGWFDTAIDQLSPVRITIDMYRDLEKNNLFEIFDADRFGKNQVFMAHGREDAVIDPAKAEQFATRFQIPLMWFDGEGHSLGGKRSTPLRVADTAVSFYRGEFSSRP